jgi:probable lipoprotein NlpC
MKRDSRLARDMVRILPAALAFCINAGLFAAPLEGGYAQAPDASATAREKAAAVRAARLKVIAAAETYEKTPYRYGGVDRNGLDCSGLIYVSFRDALGVSVPRTTGSLYGWTEKIAADKAQPGDLLFFKTDNTGKISHAAIYIGGGRFIHSASAGPVTGVIYSGLDEGYWARAYAGAGRVFPETDYMPEPEYGPVAEGGETGAPANAGRGAVRPGGDVPGGGTDTAAEKNKAGLLVGLAAAPTWNGFLKDSGLVRGVAGQVRVGGKTYTFGKPMIFGLELRPEYDGALGVFRLPLTFSWGPSEKFLLFAGPVFSFGDAALSTENGERRYSGGTSWLGAAGVSAAPFLFTVAGGELAPYLEAAWQSYFSDNPDKNLNADFSAGFRFSTGIRYTWKL